MNNDIIAIKKYQNAVNSGKDANESLKVYMNEASQEAFDFASKLGFLDGKLQLSNEQLIKYQNSLKGLEVTNIATNKSIMNCSSLINEYNSGLSVTDNICKNTGLSQKDLVSSIGASNQVLGNYLDSLNGGEASLKGYKAALVGAKLETIGLQIASTALNMAISMGVALAIQGILTLVSKAIHYYDDLADKVNEVTTKYKDSQDSIQSHSKTISEISDRYKELSAGVDLATGKNLTLSDGDYQEFLDISNQLAETFPTLTRHYDENGNAIVQLNGDAQTITSTLNISNTKQIPYNL